MNFAHTQKSFFTIVIQKSLLEAQIMNPESQKSPILFFGLLLLFLVIFFFDKLYLDKLHAQKKTI